MQNFISIPKPCNENWDNMTPQEQGRHCAKCNIVVQDFSVMSNEEILQYLNKNTGRVCGRVDAEQLASNPTLSDRLKKFVYAFAMCFLPLNPFVSFGQNINSTQTEKIIEYGSIEGKVIDAKGEPIPFASVGAFEGDILKGQDKTNFNGNYKIKPLAKGIYTLKISSVGFAKLAIHQVDIPSHRNRTQNITLKKRQTIDSTQNQAQVQNIIFSGKILNDKNEGIPFAKISLYRAGNLIHSTKSHLNGDFKFKNIELGIYDISLISIGYSKKTINNFEIKNSRLQNWFGLKKKPHNNDKVIIKCITLGIISPITPPSQQNISGEEINKLPK